MRPSKALVKARPAPPKAKAVGQDDDWGDPEVCSAIRRTVRGGCGTRKANKGYAFGTVARVAGQTAIGAGGKLRNSSARIVIFQPSQLDS